MKFDLYDHLLACESYCYYILLLLILIVSLPWEFLEKVYLRNEIQESSS